MLRDTLKLSDAFMQPPHPDLETFEVIIPVYYINFNNRSQFFERSGTLYQYSDFIATERKYIAETRNLQSGLADNSGAMRRINCDAAENREPVWALRLVLNKSGETTQTSYGDYIQDEPQDLF